MTDKLEHIPQRLTVSSLVDSRYPDGRRPLTWDERREGLDTIKTPAGQTLRLRSDGQQSPPQPGWVIMITGGNSDEGYHWTLYGIPEGATATL